MSSEEDWDVTKEMIHAITRKRNTAISIVIGGVGSRSRKVAENRMCRSFRMLQLFVLVEECQSV
jgi:hypothetical protein